MTTLKDIYDYLGAVTGDEPIVDLILAKRPRTNLSPEASAYGPGTGGAMFASGGEQAEGGVPQMTASAPRSCHRPEPVGSFTEVTPVIDGWTGRPMGWVRGLTFWYD